ncbi:MAG: alternative ribosome rescue aminoacyl-tRNA hydrolase ArfB [Desulfovibrionaceae bacterium]
MLPVNDRIAIPDDEITFTTARASGPGGQHVNTTDSAVTLRFALARSKALSVLDKTILKGKLRRRINAKGELLLTCRTSRSQFDNKRQCLERLARLLAEALAPIRDRIDTRPTRASQNRRVQAKKVRAAIKRRRRPPGDDD